MKDLVLGVCSARSILDGTAPMRQYKKNGSKKGCYQNLFIFRFIGHV